MFEEKIFQRIEAFYAFFGNYIAKSYKILEKRIFFSYCTSKKKKKISYPEIESVYFAKRAIFPTIMSQIFQLNSLL